MNEDWFGKTETYEEWEKREQLPQPYPMYNAATVRKLVDRMKILEQRVIDLQGHDDFTYIDRKLSEQEEVERLRAKKKQIYEDLKDAVEAKLKEKNGE